MKGRETDIFCNTGINERVCLLFIKQIYTRHFLKGSFTYVTGMRTAMWDSIALILVRVPIGASDRSVAFNICDNFTITSSVYKSVRNVSIMHKQIQCIDCMYALKQTWLLGC